MGKKELEIIKAFLKENKISFEHLTHEHVHSSHDAAKIRGNKIEQAAKAIVIKAKQRNNEYKIIQCVLPGHKKIDMKKLRKTLDFKSVSLADPKEVLEKTGCTIGSVPPFGFLLGIETYADESITNEEEIVFSAGTHNDSIRIRSEDYLNFKEIIKETNFIK